MLEQEKYDYKITILLRDVTVWEDSRVCVLEGDLKSLSKDIFYGQSYDIVIHLAALMADKDSFPQSEFVKVNVEGSKRLIMSLQQCKIKQFIHISTVMVYDHTDTLPASEETKIGQSLTNYEYSKRESELCIRACCQKLGVPLTILRLGLIYGEGMTYGWPNVIDSIQKRKMKIIGDGKNLIQLSYIYDVVDGIILTINNPRAYDLIFNLCS